MSHMLTLEDLSSRGERRTRSVTIRSLSGDVVLQELTAADVIWLTENAGSTTNLVKARVALSLKEPCLGEGNTARLVALEGLLPGLPEGAWDELVAAVLAFHRESLVLPTESLRRALESIPELWGLLAVAKRAGALLTDGSPMSRISFWCAALGVAESGE